MPLTELNPDALARLYASSIYQLAEEAGGQTKIEEVAAELADLVELSRTDAKFGEFLASRILPAKERAKSITTIFKNRVSDLTLRFLLVLNRKGRLDHLPTIAAAFQEKLQNAFGRMEVDVYTAAPATADELSEVRNRLKAVLRREPVIYAYTEPAMIGGLKLQIGDQLIDASVRTRLRKMRENLGATGATEIRTKADRMVD